MKSCRSSHPRCATHRCSYVPPPPKQPYPIQRRLPYHLSLLLLPFKLVQPRSTMATVCSICTAILALPIIFIRRCHVHRPFIRILYRPAAAALPFRRMAAIQLAIMQPFQKITMLLLHTAGLNPRSILQRPRQLPPPPAVVVVDRHLPSPDRPIHSLDLSCRRLDAMSPFGSSPARRSNLMSRYNNNKKGRVFVCCLCVLDAGVVSSVRGHRPPHDIDRCGSVHLLLVWLNKPPETNR